MRIAIDASRSTVKRSTGTEHYAYQLIKHLIGLNDQLPEPNQLDLYFREAVDETLFPKSPHVQQMEISQKRLWTHLGFAKALWPSRPDICFVPAHTLPFIFPGKACVTVHDLGYKHFPEAHPFQQRLYLDLTTRFSAKRAQVVLVDSEATAQDLVHFYGIDERKMRLVYPGVEIHQKSPLDAIGLRQKYGLPARYFLFLGTLQPRKNIERLLQAFDRFQKEAGSESVGLVLAGAKGWLYDEKWAEGIPNITFTGYVDEVDKGLLYQEAEAFVFPSLYEGFGFPVLEAMHCRTPVISSQTSSLPELVGEAGLLVDPLNIEAMAAAMQAILKPEIRAPLIQKGLEQVRLFTWEAAAKRCLEALMAYGNHP